DFFFAWFGIFEHLGASGTAAQAPCAAAFHFYQLGIQGGQYFAWSFVYVVYPAQVARVMIGNPLSFETASALKPNFPFIDELLQKGSMVDYFIVASQFRILVFEGIEAMRAGRHNFLDIVTIQHLY